MTFEQLNNAVRARFQSAVVDVLPGGLPTQYDNQDAATFTRPDGTRWCRFVVRPERSEQVTLGAAPRFRTSGVAVAQLHTPLGEGDREALQIADAVCAAFRHVTVGGVTYRTPRLRRVGAVRGAYRIDVECPFTADDVA